MMPPKIRSPKRPNMRRVVILFPSGLTLGNLFFGIFAIVTASRGDFRLAGIWVLWGGICDALDGRVARATNAGSEFGEELDSLVDAISFGLAPAMIMYFAVLNRDGWDWIFVFLFAACAVLRLARFNIEQAGTAKTYFQGLPSPAAGITLASYYWFSQSWMYNYTRIGDLPWQEMLRFIMAALAILMISNVPYPAFPRAGFRSVRALGASILVLGSLALLATRRLEYFFPLTLIYVAWGLIRWIFSELFERRQPTIPYDLSEGESELDEEEEFAIGTSQVHAERQAAREPRLPREDRTKKLRSRDESAERPARAPEERAAKSERPERTDRADRPPRTEADRAARREKRDKRDKREGRPERAPRPPRQERTADTTDIATVVAQAMVGADLSTEASGDDEVIGRIPGGGDITVATLAGETTAPTRKRKRRRRRGERKERAPGDPLGPPSGGDDGGDDDGGPDEGPDDASPYSPPAFPVSMPPIPAPSPAPSPTPPPPPSTTSSEPHE
jgi:CDP-diacylglycerol--serine O-phosphatidyltransferase